MYLSFPCTSRHSVELQGLEACDIYCSPWFTNRVEGLLGSQIVSSQGGGSRIQGVYIQVKEYILKQGCFGCPKLSAISRARPTVKYGSNTT
jgi:hypothetical protein